MTSGMFRYHVLQCFSKAKFELLPLERAPKVLAPSLYAIQTDFLLETSTKVIKIVVLEQKNTLRLTYMGHLIFVVIDRVLIIYLNGVSVR